MDGQLSSACTAEGQVTLGRKALLPFLPLSSLNNGNDTGISMVGAVLSLADFRGAGAGEGEEGGIMCETWASLEVKFHGLPPPALTSALQIILIITNGLLSTLFDVRDKRTIPAV
ncbi:hypothetical protein PoB_006199500 [Plakobranchus ocellatus]|uniref:Uncharacterized protein n=1 Tax=Plakobranchus ocellatus TaxID=259542 RepID=A0AAV4CUC4_9GAST|nr:hypothetical protein PoB_006199500 [Plakobranchus ocellatus]